MSDYLTANRKKIKAIIGLGDLVTGSVKRVFDQVGVKPGEIPVVGWGNSRDTTQEVMDGYVNAGAMAGPAGDELSGAVGGRTWRPTAFRRASTSSSAPSTTSTTAPIYDKVLSRQISSRPAPCAARRRSAGSASTDREGGDRGRGRRTRRPARERGERPLCANDKFVGRLIATPEFGPLVLLCVELFVFWAINHNFLSSLNISNTLTFTVELGLIALADDVADDCGRVRSFGRLGVRLRAGADVDALTTAARRRWKSPSWPPSPSRR